MDFHRAKWIALAGVVLATLLAAIALRSGPHVASGKEGEVVADFALQRVTAVGLDPHVLDGPQQHRDKPLLLHFWAPSCGPCRDELPVWQDLSQHATDFAILTVAGDESEDVAAYMREHHLTLPTVWDENGTAHRALAVWTIPHTFAISRTGVVVRDRMGAQTRESLEEAVAAASK